ncbi:MAG: FecR domain-containing protein [Candidatus Rokuibacteriota bacterium]
MLKLRRPAVTLLVIVALWPTLLFGQEKAGVVTTLEGHVTAARAAVPQPILLKFKDDVYRQDRITTGDRSLARMLLGGKAVVTVRERSVITITEVPGRSTIDLVTGKIGLAVAKERMKPGEQIAIKTPNAVCAVRGTVVVAEVQSTTAQAGAGAPGIVTHFYVLRGAIEVLQLVPGTNTPTGGPLAVNTLQSFTAAGSAPPHVYEITPAQLDQITDGLTPSGMQQSRGTTDQVVNDQLSMAGRLGDTIIQPACCPLRWPFATPSSTLTESPAATSTLSGTPISSEAPVPPGILTPPAIPIPPVTSVPPAIVTPPDGGRLRGLDRADQVAGPHGRQGRDNAREKQGR